MPRLPGISQKDAVRVFQKLGYRIVRESGHLILSNGECRLVIPRHAPINAITMGAIARDAGLTPSSSASCSESSHMRLGPLWQQPSLTQVAPCSRLFAEPARLHREGGRMLTHPPFEQMYYAKAS